jgi:hypothetical protein
MTVRCVMRAKVQIRRPFCGDTVLFLRNEKEHGTLLGSGVIIPGRHAETVFALTPDAVYATLALLNPSKHGWTSIIIPMDIMWGGTAGRWKDNLPCMLICMLGYAKETHA